MSERKQTAPRGAPSPDSTTGAPSEAINAVAAKKQPPPESQQSILTRRLVVFSFWAVVIFLGLPIWWKTTTIYRASLPLQSMTDWADGKMCRLTFPLKIAVEAPSLPSQDAQHLIRTMQHALDDLNEFSTHHLRLVLSDKLMAQNVSRDATVAEVGKHNVSYGATNGGDTALTIRLFPENSGSLPRAELQPYKPTLDVFYAPNQIPPSSSTSSPLATFIANELQSLYAEEQARLAYLLSSNSAAYSAKTKLLSPETIAVLDRQSTRAFKYAPTYHLTFSLFTPTAVPSGWNIEAALQEYIAPLLDALSEISNFTVDTQVQLYATFSPSIRQPEFDAEQQLWTLRQEDLSGFINAAEWPLSPSIGVGPTVNFVLYVPSSTQSPLVVKENGGNSWLIPQWGGVLILNPSVTAGKPANVPQTLSKEALEPAMFTFAKQLLSLMGLPESPSSLPLRLSTLTRVRAASLLFSASSTLGALARLTQALPSIAIPDTVADSVTLTTAHLTQSCNALREGRFHAALEHARIAETEAEKAFFERSMVGMVYFPDEHKVAVYLPLLGPVAVPLILGGLKEIRKMTLLRKKP